MEHPPPDVLLRFLRATASRPENQMVVRHLLARCPACAATLRQLRHGPPLSPPPSPEDYGPAFDRAALLEESMNDPLDHMSADELIDAATEELQKALAYLARIRQTLGSLWEEGPRIGPVSPSPGGRGGLGERRARVQPRSPRKRGPYPRRVK